jgi:hypothetical protein
MSPGTGRLAIASPRPGRAKRRGPARRSGEQPQSTPAGLPGRRARRERVRSPREGQPPHRPRHSARTPRAGARADSGVRQRAPSCGAQPMTIWAIELTTRNSPTRAFSAIPTVPRRCSPSSRARAPKDPGDLRGRDQCDHQDPRPARRGFRRSRGPCPPHRPRALCVQRRAQEVEGDVQDEEPRHPSSSRERRQRAVASSVRTTLPIFCQLSTYRTASTTSSSRYTRSTTGRYLPASRSSFRRRMSSRL